MKAALGAVVALLATHEILARVLDRLDLVERLLAPGPDALVALPLALVLYAVRLALVFVAPGLVALAFAREVRRGWS